LIVSLVVVTVSLPWTSPAPASAGPLVWGALSGLGTAIGSLALYRGFARGEMSVVGPISAVGAALLPAVVGVFLGERLRLLAICAVIVALPAIGLISKGSSTTGASIRAGAIDGCVAGVGFGMLFIGLNRAGSQSGLWPVAAGELAATLLIGLAIVVTRPTRPTHIGPAGLLTVTTGLLGILGITAYFYATHLGILTLAAVVTSLYPAFTVLLAAIVLHERPNRTQLLGLALGAAAIVGIVAS
ncbi:MAG: DMT family transporter, partial [Leifsonia sp.]